MWGKSRARLVRATGAFGNCLVVVCLAVVHSLSICVPWQPAITEAIVENERSVTVGGYRLVVAR